MREAPKLNQPVEIRAFRYSPDHLIADVWLPAVVVATCEHSFEALVAIDGELLRYAYPIHDDRWRVRR